MPLEQSNGKITLRTDSGASQVEVLAFGATVISWKDSRGAEQLFLSRKTPLDGSAAIRGGIPIVFPVFGSPTDHEDHRGLEKLPKHGFARTSTWSVGEEQQTAHGTSVTLTLDTTSNKDIQSVYPHPLILEYKISLSDSPSQLSTTLTVKHTSASASEPARFHALLHNYLHVPDVRAAGVSGLQGLRYTDKNDNKAVKTESDATIVLSGQASDRVYEGSAPDVTLSFDGSSSSSNAHLRVTRTSGFPDTTVWNPAEEAAKGMKDLHEGGWQEYICIEPGHVSSLAELAPGKEWSATQTLEVIDGKSKV